MRPRVPSSWRAVAAALIVATAVAVAEPMTARDVPVEVIDRASTYEVTADNAVELTHEMAERGPQHPTGRRAWAYTSWELRANYTLEQSRGRCRLADATVLLEVDTTLPSWTPRHPPRAALRLAWRRMLESAREHERVHRLHAVEAAGAAASALTNAGEASTCAGVEKRVRTALRRASDDAAAKSRQFDRDTDYGRRAGVRLGD